MRNPRDPSVKPILELDVPSLQKINDEYFFIGNQRDVFILNKGGVYASKLSEEEITSLSVELVYTGPEDMIFLNNEETALELLVKIIKKVNLVQTSDVHSFPLGRYKFFYFAKICCYPPKVGKYTIFFVT